jgi:hypothetical protein
MAFIAKGLQIFGALALAALLSIIGLFTYSIFLNTDRTNVATKKEAQFIFNSSGLKVDQDYKVLSSFQSERTFTGDYLDHFCLQISDFAPNENHKKSWGLVSTLNRPVQDAVSQAESFGNASECFGRAESELKNIQVHVQSVLLINGSYPSSFEIILFDAQTNRLLYVGSKT